MAKQKTSFTKFIAELLIVFVGVYGAFELNRYQQNQRESEVRKSYFTSFKSELVKLTYDIKNTQKTIDQAIIDFETALTNGDRPKPKPLNLVFDAPMLITKAGFNDDVFIQLEEGLAASLSGGYDNVQLVSQSVKRFNALCDRNLISNTPISFYYRTGQLKPEFDWYMENLKTLQRYMNNLDNMIQKGAMPAVMNLIENY